MATYSAAPGITVSGKLSNPNQSGTGSSSDSYTVPSNSYAIISIYSARTISYLDGTTGVGVTSGASDTSTLDGNFTGMVLGQSIVAAGETVSVTNTVHTGLGTDVTFVTVSGETIFNDTTGSDIHVHYVVFS